MNKIEQANYKKLVNDISSDHLSDQEIVEMWLSPAIQQIDDGLSNFKLEQFLISKGVSKEYAPKGVEWILSKSGVKNTRTSNKVTVGSTLTDMLHSLTEKFKHKD